jgi:uncharacterized membrane protein YebE (DUF533 family)
VFGGAASNNADFIAANDEAIADGVLDDDERAELDDQSATGEAMETAGWALMGIGVASLVAISGVLASTTMGCGKLDS